MTGWPLAWMDKGPSNIVELERKGREGRGKESKERRWRINSKILLLIWKSSKWITVHNTIHLFMSCQVGHSPPATIVNRVISRLQGFTNVLVGFVSVQRSPLQFDNFPSSSTSTTPPAQTMDYYYRSLVPLNRADRHDQSHVRHLCVSIGSRNIAIRWFTGAS